MYTTVYKALFQSISVTIFLIDQPLLEEVLWFQNTLNYFLPLHHKLEVVWHHVKQNLGTLFSVCFDFIALFCSRENIKA